MFLQMCYAWTGRKKKGIVNFKAIICNTGIIAFNLQKKQKRKKKCAENENRMKTGTEWKFQHGWNKDKRQWVPRKGHHEMPLADLQEVTLFFKKIIFHWKILASLKKI